MAAEKLEERERKREKKKRIKGGLANHLFKDKGGLANHPLSCHPQGVFGSREIGRKGEKKRKKEKERENSRPVLYISNVENEKSLLQDLL